jgi:hypothetical protein
MGIEASILRQPPPCSASVPALPPSGPLHSSPPPPPWPTQQLEFHHGRLIRFNDHSYY